jgi:hypothetical protein
MDLTRNDVNRSLFTRWRLDSAKSAANYYIGITRAYLHSYLNF